MACGDPFSAPHARVGVGTWGLGYLSLLTNYVSCRNYAIFRDLQHENKGAAAARIYRACSPFSANWEGPGTPYGGTPYHPTQFKH